MKYITYLRFQGNSISGNINLPALTEIVEQNGTLYFQDKPICLATSENAHKHFARDDDNMGMERGSLIKQIIKLLSKQDKNYQNRWDKIWKDTLCQKFKHSFHTNNWLWNHSFYNADIKDLKYIYILIK